MADPRTLTYDDTATLANADMNAHVDPISRLDELRRCVSYLFVSLSQQLLFLNLGRPPIFPPNAPRSLCCLVRIQNRTGILYDLLAPTGTF
jgi:hypothetical protein